MSFIYCFDDETKEEMLSKGFKLLNETEMSDRKAYQFLYNKEIKFEELDKTKILLSNKINF